MFTIFLLLTKQTNVLHTKLTAWKPKQSKFHRKRNQKLKFVSLLLNPSSTILENSFPCRFQFRAFFFLLHNLRDLFHLLASAFTEQRDLLRSVRPTSMSWKISWSQSSPKNKSKGNDFANLSSTNVLTSNLLNFGCLHSFLTYCWRLRWVVALLKVFDYRKAKDLAETSRNLQKNRFRTRKIYFCLCFEGHVRCCVILTKNTVQ